MLNSHMSNVYRHDATGRIVGACLSTVWPVDKDYDAFEVDPTHWLNTAAEIAEVNHQ